MASALVPLFLLYVFAAVKSQPELVRCRDEYTMSAGNFFNASPHMRYVELPKGETDVSTRLWEKLDVLGQPRITGIKVFVCHYDDQPRDLTLTFNNGILAAEQTSRQALTSLIVEYVELPLPYAALEDGAKFQIE